ncbi:hypothetical protein BDZ45DRAFT_148462 [Acephala macrosclerotiorum]|nr:hypothetical protein BDZ45DRAFT_148462 [Acephala macrosclerotiorum]
MPHDSSTSYGSYRSSKSKPGDSKTRNWHWEQVWFCCQCHPSDGAGPLAGWNDHCPCCSGPRCSTCTVENIKVLDCRGDSGSGYVGGSALPSAQTPRTPPLLFSESVKNEPSSHLNEHRDELKTNSPHSNKLESAKTRIEASSTLLASLSASVDQNDSLDGSLPSDASSAIATIFSLTSSRPTTSTEVSSSQVNLEVAHTAAADGITEKTSQIDLSSTTAAAGQGCSKRFEALHLNRLSDSIKDRDPIEPPCLDPRVSFARDFRLSPSIDLSGPSLSLAKDFAPHQISSPRSPDQSGVFTDENSSTATDMDWDTDSQESGDDDAEMEPECIYERIMLQHLDLCISTACRHNLSLAAILIPQIHAVVRSGNYSGRRYTTSAAGSGGETDAGDGNGSSSSRAAGPSSNQDAATCGISNGQSGKRSREPNDPGRPNKRQRKPPEEGTPPTDAALDDGPTFACHFYKRDPDKYNNRRNRKYTNCPHPTIPHNDLRRRLKDHFKNHRLTQYDRCYNDFGNGRALVEHHQSLDLCERQHSSLKEGIDDGEWERISNILYKKTDKGKSDFEKWFDIWKILFPGIDPPQTPWNESESLSMGPFPDNEAIIRNFESRLATGVDQGVLPHDPQLYECILSILCAALETQSPNSTSPRPRVPEVNAQSRYVYDINSSTDTNDNSGALSWLSSAPNQMNEATRPSNADNSLQLSDLQPAAESDHNPPPIPTALNSSTNDIPDPQSNDRTPDWDSLGVPYLPTNPDPRTSNFGFGSSDNPSFDETERPYEYGITNDDLCDYLNIDTFMAQECIFDVSESQGDAFGFYHKREEFLSRGETMTDLSSILEPELENLGPAYLEPRDTFSRKGRHKTLKEQFRLDFGG